MKYLKLFLLLAAAPFLGACSDDDESWNSAADVTVNMKNPTMRIKESAGMVNVPIEVTGTTNGKVHVTVAVEETGSNPAKEDVNYYITSKELTISDGEGNIELETKDDDEINDDRTFNITIVDAKGAKIGDNATTAVTLRDNDSEFYEKLQGTWKMTCVYNDKETSWNVKVVGATDENDTDYNSKLYITGMAGYAWTTAELSYHYNKTTQKGYVAFDNLGGYNFAEGVTFPDPIGTANVKLYAIEGEYLSTTPLNGIWDDSFKNITFDEGELAGAIFSTSGEFTRYSWFTMSNIKLTKEK